MIKRNPKKFTLMLVLVVFCAVSAFVYLTLGAGTTKSVVEQMLHREQIIARSGARSIRSLLVSSANSLFVLADNEKIITPDANTKELLKQIVDNWQGTPLSLVALVDTKGNIVAAASNQDQIVNIEAKATGRDYFENGLKLAENSFFVGKPLLPLLSGLQNKYLVPISVPVYKDGQVTGIIVATFYISDLTSAYLDPLKISDQTDIILIDENGFFLTSIHPEVVGQNVFDYINQHPFLGDKILVPLFKDKIKIDEEQKYDVVIPNLFKGKLTRTLIASAPINYGDGNRWILVITTPVDDALLFVSPFIMQNLVGIIVTFFGGIAIAIFLYNRYIKT